MPTLGQVNHMKGFGLIYFFLYCPIMSENGWADSK